MRIARSTVILLVANLLAFGLVWQSTYEHNVPVATQSLVFPVTIEKIELTEGASKLTIEKKNLTWAVTSPFTWSANLWSVQRLLDELRLVDSEKGFAASEVKLGNGSLSTYGLESPRWALQVVGENGNKVEVKIGENKDTRRVFLLTPDRQRIIPLGDALAAALETKPENYRVDKIFDISEFEVRAVSIRQQKKDGDALTKLTYEEQPRVGRRNQGAEWHFESPFIALADAERMTKAIGNLTNLRAQLFTPKILEEYGLATPDYRIGMEGNARRQVLLIGKPKADNPTQRWAKLEDNETAFLIDTQSFTEWFNPNSVLLATRPSDFDPELVTGYTLTSRGRSITLHRLESGSAEARWEIPVAPGTTATQRREADARKVRTFLSSLSQLRALNQSSPAGDSTIPWLIPASSLSGEPMHKIEIEFGGEKISIAIYDGSENQPSGAILVYPKGATFAALCEGSFLRSDYQEVSPQAWRSKTVAELAAGNKVSGLRLIERSGQKVLGEARLGPDGNWAGTGQLDPANSRRLAEALAQVKASEYVTRDIGAGEWKYELRVTDQAAAGVTGASEKFRTYLCSAPLSKTAILMRDEGDTDSFLLDVHSSEILVPIIEPNGR